LAKKSFYSTCHVNLKAPLETIPHKFYYSTNCGIIYALNEYQQNLNFIDFGINEI